MEQRKNSSNYFQYIHMYGNSLIVCSICTTYLDLHKFRLKNYPLRCSRRCIDSYLHILDHSTADQICFRHAHNLLQKEVHLVLLGTSLCRLGCSHQKHTQNYARVKRDVKKINHFVQYSVKHTFPLQLHQ